MTPLLSTILLVISAGVHIAVIFVLLLLEQRRPASTLAWLLAVVFLPYVGLALFLLLGTRRMVRRTRKRSAAAKRLAAVFERHRIDEKMDQLRDPAVDDERTASFARLATKLIQSPTTFGNASELLINATMTYRALFAAIRGAEHHIHVQFYIIKGDRWGQILRDRLAARAREGVEVRVLVDAVGSYGLSRNFWSPLLEAGGKVGIFKPVNPLVRLRRRDRVDFRNHRKIVVVDGRLGFTGGINIGKEYLGLNPDLGHWRDTHVKIEGPAALALQRIFAEDWWLTTAETLDNEAYFPEPPEQPAGRCAVQILDSGPDQRWSPIHMFYIQAITLAKRRIWVTSPYFVPDDVLETALTGAALRGVDVRLLVPSKSDVRLITWASRSYYQGMLDAGIRIYEYARGFVHAKTMVVDDWVAAVGSANLDIRSFHLNFEVNAFIFSRHLASELADQFRSDLRDAHEVSAHYRDELGIGPRLLQSFARLLSPLL